MRSFNSKAEHTEPADRPLDHVTFELDGVTFACNGTMTSTFGLSDLARQAMRGDGAAGAASTAELFLQILGQAEYDRFVAHVTEYGTDDEVIAEIADFVHEQGRSRTEADAERPTAQRSRSPRGPQGQGERTRRVISLQRGDVTVIGEDGKPVPQDHKAKGGKARTA